MYSKTCIGVRAGKTPRKSRGALERDSGICGTRLLHMQDMTHSHVGQDSFTLVGDVSVNESCPTCE